MKRLKIVADNTIPYLKGIAEPVAEMIYVNSKCFTPEIIKEADALIVRSIDKCTRQLLEGSSVKLITTATIGFDHIDTHYCQEAGITWYNAPGCNAASVGQYILASLLTLSLRKGVSLKGKTIGIVGVGHVGQIVEHLCRVMGMRVLRNDPPRAKAEGNDGFVSLDQIAEEADIITLHVPFTREGDYPTYHLADTSFFQKLKKNPWFINSCRGAVHDTEALLAAKREGKISELIIDCWENEPVISRELLQEAAIATPHIAGFSADGKANGTRICLEHIADFFHITLDKLKEVTPPTPLNPIIDMDQFQENRIEQTILAAFSPLTIDKRLREHPEQFEYFRAHYDHPREYRAFKVIHATEEEASLLTQLYPSFQIG